MKAYMCFCEVLSVTQHKSERKAFDTHDAERNQNILGPIQFLANLMAFMAIKMRGRDSPELFVCNETLLYKYFAW